MRSGENALSAVGCVSQGMIKEKATLYRVSAERGLVVSVPDGLERTALIRNPILLPWLPSGPSAPRARQDALGVKIERLPCRVGR